MTKQIVLSNISINKWIFSSSITTSCEESLKWYSSRFGNNKKSHKSRLKTLIFFSQPNIKTNRVTVVQLISSTPLECNLYLDLECQRFLQRLHWTHVNNLKSLVLILKWALNQKNIWQEFRKHVRDRSLK